MMFRNNNPQQEDALFLMDSCIYFLYNEACPVYIFFFFIYYFFVMYYIFPVVNKMMDEVYHYVFCSCVLLLLALCVCVCVRV